MSNWRLKLNETESRQIFRTVGCYYNRHMQHVQSCNQIVIRKNTESFVQHHWSILKDQLSCNGDCSSNENVCTDVQAATCYLMNENEITNFISPERGRNAKKKKR